MGGNRQARRRQRKNKRARDRSERLEAIKAAGRIAEDAELGRHERLRMCTYKRRYAIELEAIRAAIGSSRKFGKPFRYYQCPHCGMWHLTSLIHDDESSASEVEELRAADATYLATPEQVESVAAALDSEREEGFYIWDLLEIGEFACAYLELYRDEGADEAQLQEGFREACEGLGFDMACGDRFAARYPEAALYDASALKGAINLIEDIALLGSAIFFKWRYVTQWSEGELADSENRAWFDIALERLAVLSGSLPDEGREGALR